MADPGNDNGPTVGGRAADEGAQAGQLVQGDGSTLFHALRDALLDRRLTVSDHRVYAEILAQPLYERGGVMACRPSRARLAIGSSLRPVNVTRSVRNLTECGYIEVRAGTGRATSQYRLPKLARGISPDTGINLLDPAVSHQIPLKRRSGIPPDTPRTRRGIPPDTQLLKQPQSVALPRSSDGFDRFWQLYPRKEAKAAAVKAWGRRKLHSEAKTILADVEARLQDANTWTDPKFIPMASSYLNGSRWLDEWRQDSKPAAGKAPAIEMTEAEQLEYIEAQRKRFGL